jgi:DNA-binding protein H-NS
MPRSTRDSLGNIEKQIARLQAQAKALQAAEDGKKAKAVQRVLVLMKKLGLEVEDLTPAARPVRAPKGRKAAAGSAGSARKAPGRKRAATASGSVAPKFRDPVSGTTWSGRGRTPVWLSKYIEQGRSRDEFAIQPEPAAS